VVEGSATDSIPAAEAGTAEANKQLVQEYLAGFWDRRDMSYPDKFLAKDVVFHDLAESPLGIPAGVEGPKTIAKIFWNAAPDLVMTWDDFIAQGDKVCVRYTCYLTHTGELAGLPPTYRKAEFGGMSILRVADNRIVEGWGVLDFVTAYQQLGVIPAGPPPAPMRLYIGLRGKYEARKLHKQGVGAGSSAPLH
jgi:predicted ester cyclase